MRRTDREVTDVQKMKVILDRCKIVSYAMWDGEKPQKINLSLYNSLCFSQKYAIIFLTVTSAVFGFCSVEANPD